MIVRNDTQTEVAEIDYEPGQLVCIVGVLRPVNLGLVIAVNEDDLGHTCPAHVTVLTFSRLKYDNET